MEAVRKNRSRKHVFSSPDRFSDWPRWKIPELRGRIADDVRFEIYDKEFFQPLSDDNWEEGRTGSRPDGDRIIVVDETDRSSTVNFLQELVLAKIIVLR